MTPENTAENLVKLSKPELQEKYKEVIGAPADAALTKQDLAEAIVKYESAGAETQNGGSNAQDNDASGAGTDGAGPDQGDPGDEHKAGSGATPQTPTAPASTETPNAVNTPENTAENLVPDGHLRLVKVENGKVVDQTTMTQAVWDNLPAHKFGWSIAKPKELQ